MPAPQQGNQSDNSTSILWGIAAAFAIVGVLWFTLKNYIIAYYLKLKLFEVSLLSLVSSTHFQPIKGNIEVALNHVNAVSFAYLTGIGQEVGNYLRFPFVIILIILAFALYFSNNTRIYRHLYSMKELAKLEKENWPQILPVIGLDLVKADIDKGPWAMAMTPLQFCKRFNLIEEIRPQRREGISRKEWDRIDIALKKGDANKLFAMQLGPMWQGVERLPPPTKALFAVFAARINADSQSAAKLLLRLNASSQGQLSMEGVDDLLKKHYKTKLVQQIIQSHAYVLTIMASMLEGARSDGVQASADFLWLKAIDRKLWYTLNTVGRQTPFSEVAGIFAHWVAEKEAGRKLLVPMVEEATKALELALRDVIYRPDDEATTA